MATTISGSTGISTPAITTDEVTFNSGGNYDDATGLLESNGYQKLPNGLIMQWGIVTTAGGTVIINYPITFPNAVFTAVASFGTDGNPQNPIQVTLTSTSQLTLTNYANGNTTKRWFAIGW